MEARGLCGMCYARRYKKEPDEYRAANLKKYQLNDASYARLLRRQDFTCPICGLRSFTLVVDHAHSCCKTIKKSCGRCIRGLLCADCNAAIGLLKENPISLQNAIHYLTKGDIDLSWESIKLADVQPEAFEAIPSGSYTFTLLPGATLRINKFGTEELVASAAIAEGPEAGRRVFLQYPDPASVNSETGKKATWSAQALKKLEIALGTDQAEAETPVDYLNRVASNGHSTFTMTIGPNPKNGKIGPSLFSVAPAL